MQKYLIALLIIPLMRDACAQTGTISGRVTHAGKPLELVNISLGHTLYGTVTDEAGRFEIKGIPLASYEVRASFIGFQTQVTEVVADSARPDPVIDISLEEGTDVFDQVVVTGTRTFKRQTDSPVIVNVLSNGTLEHVQACNAAEGLRFQPGLRVETDCQTCNYTQLRMNGLGGAYSQILINGRPVFSPLTGLYGLEQIPANMIERVEVVRGGGSALYGSSAVGGTVNIITRIPKRSGYDLNLTTQSINGEAADHLIGGNLNLLAPKGNAGAAVFVGRRKRQAYDHNGDGFSELPELRNNAFGANLFFQPDEDQKLELNFTSLNEYRYGGERKDGPAHLAQQSEERTHNVLMAGLDYQLNFNGDDNSIIAYLAGQRTDRDHYTGIFPDAPGAIAAHRAEPPYGFTESRSFQAGVQFNHRITHFLGGSNALTVGTEYTYDEVFDAIAAYRYVLDQTARNLGGFLQSDWQITSAFTFLAGLRIDGHNLVDRVLFSPRLSLLYRLREFTQFRLTWGQGFRAPQAFDADMHIAFAGGGVSRIALSPDLREERSNSFSGSINFDRPAERFIAGFTLEGFYTRLDDAFFLHPVGEDAFGERYEKRNGPGAVVRGGTLELRANYDRKVQLEAGFTLQSSRFEEPVDNIDELEPRREFLRSPDAYGFWNLTFTPGKRFGAAFSGVYTGPMLLAHFGGAPEQPADAYKTSPAFTELNLKLGYTFPFQALDSGLELFGGVKNLTNAYQDDFDTGKNRDSNYVYGPGMPRTLFVGLRLKSL